MYVVRCHDLHCIKPLFFLEELPEVGVGSYTFCCSEGARAIDEGWVEKNGKLPVNPSGGLKSKGHPIGATGVSMHVIQSMQLMGVADGMQIQDAELAGVFNMGGAAVANYVSILERIR